MTTRVGATCHACGVDILMDARGLWAEEGVTNERGGYYYCPTCSAERADMPTCGYCGAHVDESSEMVFSPTYGGYGSEELLCEACHDARYVECTDCGIYVNRYDAHVVYGEGAFCDDCYSDLYTECERCGDRVGRDDVYYDSDDRALCECCYEDVMHENSLGIICGYHSQRKDDNFFGADRHSGATFYGVEFETECTHSSKGLSLGEIAELARNEMPADTLFFEEDGSLDDGFETITAPMTYEYIIEHRAELSRMLAVLRDHGMRGTTHSGMHVHVSKSAFGRFETEQDLNVTKVLLITERFMSDMETLARRSECGYARAFLETDVCKLDALAKRAKNCGERYTIWNLTNYSTVEFRLPKGTTEGDTAIATVELVRQLVLAACAMSVDECSQAPSLRHALECGGAIPATLDAYMTRKGL